MLKKQDKLNLIDNYVEIYRCLYNCKLSLNSSPNNIVQLSNIDTLCEQLCQLKTLYEETFKKAKIYDEAFIQLKQELEETLSYPKTTQCYYSYDTIQNKISFLNNSLSDITTKKVR